jgi:hypothetical protein
VNAMLLIQGVLLWRGSQSSPGKDLFWDTVLSFLFLLFEQVCIIAFHVDCFLKDMWLLMYYLVYCCIL